MEKKNEFCVHHQLVIHIFTEKLQLINTPHLKKPIYRFTHAFCFMPNTDITILGDLQRDRKNGLLEGLRLSGQ